MNWPKESGEGTGRLGFLKSAFEAFGFLRRMGFQVELAKPSEVVFESPDVSVDVYHGLDSYQIGVDISVHATNSRYSLYEVLSGMAPYDLDLAGRQVTDEAELHETLLRIAEALQRSCQKLLAGDPATVSSLRSATAPGRRKLTLQAQYGPLVERADRAWNTKDFGLAYSLYRQAEPALDAHRAKRLAYLKGKNLRSGEPPKGDN